MTAPLLALDGVTKSFGGLVALDGVTLALPAGELHALIGPNGAGKSTLVGTVTGDLSPESGSIRLAGEEIGGLPGAARVARGMARTFQVAELLPEESALDNVATAVSARRGHSFRFFGDARREGPERARARALLEQVGLGGRAGAKAAALAQGERKQLELAVALACEPMLLLLDEPMAGLGAGESRQMLALLAGLKGGITMLLVEHDMDTVFALADRVSVLVYGRLIATDTPAAIQADAAVREAYLGEGDA